MKIIEEITDDQMIATFLKGETKSSRFGNTLSSIQRQLNIADSVLVNPDVSSQDENAQRKDVLAAFRGYGKSEGIFVNFPQSVRWVRAHLSTSELLQVKYADLKCWNELSQNSRLPAGAAECLKKMNPRPAEVQHFFDMENKLRGGIKFPELILVSINEDSGLVVLEGHTRLTTYALVPEFIPTPLDVIIGLAADMARWKFF
jgi:hypothetical protein